EKFDDVLDLAPMRKLLAPGAGEPVERAGDEIVPQEVVPPHHDVVEHGHVVEQCKILKGAANAERRPRIAAEPRDVLPAIQDRPVWGTVASRDAIDDRGLAGPVRTDD